MRFVGIGIIVLMGAVVAAPTLLDAGIWAKALSAVLIVVFGFLFVTVSSRDVYKRQALFLNLLARSGTAQQLSVYNEFILGPRAPGQPDGPEEMHVVFVDNGRTNVLASSCREILRCIRCGACLNVCPVYRQAGGHAYRSVYPCLLYTSRCV